MPNDLDIPELLTLPALQSHMAAFCKTRGWDKNNIEQMFLLLTEEVGELAKAVRRATKLQTEVNNPGKPVLTGDTVRQNLAEELADVLNYILDIANHFQIDMDAAYRDNILKIAGREWATAS